MKNRQWLLYTILTTVTWGIWGALIELPEKAGFPSTLGYSIWALTMIPCAIFALRLNHFRLEHDKKSLFYGLMIGFTGSGGTVLLFEVLKLGPAYIIFPIISLSPILTVILSIIFLKEKASKKSWIGIFLALIAVFLLSYSKQDGTDSKGFLWLELSILIFIMWGVQAFYMKIANDIMKAESIFAYMAVAAVSLIPVTVLMTNFHQNTDNECNRCTFISICNPVWKSYNCNTNDCSLSDYYNSFVACRLFRNTGSNNYYRDCSGFDCYLFVCYLADPL
jgi:drug/metabolite transporter (DMT)-like permease